MPKSTVFCVCLAWLILTLMVSVAGTAETLAIVGATVIDVSDFGRGDSDIGELGRTTYAEGVVAGLDAVVHTTRYSLDLAPEDMAQAVADQPFSDDLESPKWLYYRWLSELSSFDARLLQHAKVLAAGEVALMPTFSLLQLDRPWASNPWKDPREDIRNLRALETVVLEGRVVEMAVPHVDPQGD